MDEIETLAKRFGEPLRWSRTLDVSSDYVQEWIEKSMRRASEVVLAMPRPNRRVLLHTKGFYPPGIFRLPSGGVHLGESIEDAARREMGEETGLDAPLKRFLGMIDYEFRNGAQRAKFVSYVILADETRDQPVPTDMREGISEFREVEWHELAGIADDLERLNGEWRDWGRFRAVAHRLVIDAVSRERAFEEGD